MNLVAQPFFASVLTHWKNVAVLVTAILIQAIASNSTLAAEVSRRCYPERNASVGKGDYCNLKLEGEIRKGDAAQVEKLLRSPLPSGRALVYKLEISSPGGDILESLRIAELVQQNMLDVSLLHEFATVAEWRMHVDSGGTSQSALCASACVLILMSAPTRTLAYSKPRVGLHRPRFAVEFYQSQPPSTIARAQANLDSRVRELLATSGMSTELIEIMMSRASNDMYWLSGAEVASLRIEAPWYQEMRVASCGSDYAKERRTFEELRKWADNGFQNGFEGPAPSIENLSTGEPNCGRELTVRAQARFKSGKSGAASQGPKPATRAQTAQ